MAHSSPADEALRCPQCGEQNYVFARFCISCGASLDDGRQTTDDREATSSVVYRPSSGLSYQRETWLGLVVLFLVIAYALYDWRVTTVRSNAYYAGQSAVERKDWDGAVAGFLGADSYRGAPERLEEARQQVAERDRFYSEGVTASEREEWGTAIAALEKVQEIQPGYRDSATRLQQAKDSVFLNGLGGIVYLVSDGETAGLHVRDEKGKTTRLPGSDRSSTLRAISPDGTALVYDRPFDCALRFAQGLADCGIYQPEGQSIDNTQAAMRIPVLARLGEGSVLSTVELPQLDSEGTGVFAEKGLWWFSRQPSMGFFSYEVFYHNDRVVPSTECRMPSNDLFNRGSVPRADTEGVIRVSDLASGKRVVAVDPPRSRVIIAEGVGDPRQPGHETRLFIAGAAGQNPRLLQYLQGEVYQASVSRDGRWLLYVTQENSAQIVRSVGVLRLDTPVMPAVEQPNNGLPPAVPDQSALPARILESATWSGIQVNVRLSATFLPSSDEPKVIVSHTERDRETVTIYDLEEDRPIYRWSGPTDGTFRRDLSGFSHDGRYLASRRQQASGATIQLLETNPGVMLSSVRVPVYSTQVVRVQFAPRNDYLIASVQNPQGINRGSTQLIYGVKRDEGSKLASPELLATAAYPYDSLMPVIAQPAEGSLLVYVNSTQELRAVFYDGTGDTLVARNVRAVWSLSARQDLAWFR